MARNATQDDINAMRRANGTHTAREVVHQAVQQVRPDNTMHVHRDRDWGDDLVRIENTYRNLKTGEVFQTTSITYQDNLRTVTEL
jgi:hypothetical protein